MTVSEDPQSFRFGVARTHNKVLPKAGVTSFYDSFALNPTLVLKSTVVLKRPAFGNTQNVMGKLMKRHII